MTRYIVLGTATFEVEIEVEASSLTEAKRKAERRINGLSNKDIIECAYSKDVEFDLEDLEEAEINE